MRKADHDRESLPLQQSGMNVQLLYQHLQIEWHVNLKGSLFISRPSLKRLWMLDVWLLIWPIRTQVFRFWDAKSISKFQKAQFKYSLCLAVLEGHLHTHCYFLSSFHVKFIIQNAQGLAIPWICNILHIVKCKFFTFNQVNSIQLRQTGSSNFL